MSTVKQYRDPATATRRWITVGLMVSGAVTGAAVGVALTVLGKIIAGAAPADASNYQWNASAFGVLGAVLAPIVTWSALRRAPLWRTVAEPFAGALLGAGIGAALGSGPLFLLLTPLGAGAGAFSLARRYQVEATQSGRLKESAG